MQMLKRLTCGVALVSVILAVACSGESGSATDVTVSPTTSESVTSTGTPAATGPAGASGLPPTTLAEPSTTEGAAQPHFTVIAGRAVVNGDQVRVTFEMAGVPPADEADLLVYSAILHFEGQQRNTQAPINVAGGPSWYIRGSSALLFVHNANTDDPSTPLTLGGALDRDEDARTFTLTTRLPAGWPAVAAVYAQVIRFTAPYEAVDVSGSAFRLDLREGDLPASALASPEDIQFPSPIPSIAPSTYALQLPLPANWTYTNLGSEGYDAASPNSAGLAGVTVVADLDPEALLDLLVEESAGAYAAEDGDGGAIGPFAASIVVRATRDYQVAPGASAVFMGGWYSVAGNTLLLAVAEHDGVTYLAYLEVPEGGDIDEWRPILEDATFR